MKKRIITFIAILLLAGCGLLIKENLYKYDFIGESAHWTAEFKTNARMEDATVYTTSQKFILRYNGDVKELSSMKSLGYKYGDSKGRWDSQSVKEFEVSTLKKEFIDKSSGGTNEIDSKNEVIKVTVVWDGENGGEEVFELKAE